MSDRFLDGTTSPSEEGWVRCSEKLPPRWKPVQVWTSSEKFYAHRSFFGDAWVYRSGLVTWRIFPDDFWRPV